MWQEVMICSLTWQEVVICSDRKWLFVETPRHSRRRWMAARVTLQDCRHAYCVKLGRWIYSYNRQTWMIHLFVYSIVHASKIKLKYLHWPIPFSWRLEKYLFKKNTFINKYACQAAIDNFQRILVHYRTLVGDIWKSCPKNICLSILSENVLHLY